MLLAIDIGNTNTVFALYAGQALQHHWRLQTVRARTPDEYAAFLGHMMALFGLEFSQVSTVVVASVVPETRFPVSRFCEKYLNAAPRFITRADIPVEVDIKNPDEVGIDRLVNAYAVKLHYRAPAVIIDFGTATTFDVVDAQGRYAGGMIAPGIDVSLNALHLAASKLPKVSVVKAERAIGKSTVEAMQSGIYWGYLGLIEGSIRQIEVEMGAPCFVLATGGLAPLFAADTPIIQTVDENLTLKGLQAIAGELR